MKWWSGEEGISEEGEGRKENVWYEGAMIHMTKGESEGGGLVRKTKTERSGKKKDDKER